MDAPIRSSAHASARTWWWRGDLIGEWMRHPPRRYLRAARRDDTGESRPHLHPENSTPEAASDHGSSSHAAIGDG
jgi:hypothetical protein